MRVIMAVLFCSAALCCMGGCAYEFAERRYANPNEYPYTYLYYSPYPAPYYYDPTVNTRVGRPDRPEETFEGQPK